MSNKIKNIRKHDEMLIYGLKEGTSNKLLHIDSEDVPNGKNCGCVCPHCHHPLIARNKGGKNKHHFAHIGDTCTGARMTALHILAQNILAERKVILLPEYHKTFVNKDAQVRTFDDVTLEEYSKIEDNVLRPDCVCRKEESPEPLWVEIYCRHKVDDLKRKEIQSRKTYCVEVDFRDLLETTYTEQDVVARLESDSSHKEWICCPVWDNLEEQKRLKAEEEYKEQLRREEEERQKEIDRIKAERAHDEYLKEIADLWRTNPDQNVVNTIINEIRQAPYDFVEKSMYSHLVPWFAWGREYKRFPKNHYGLQVFYCLIRYYYNNINLDDRNYTRWKILDTPMWKLLNKKERTKEDDVLLEYMIVIWALNILNNHKRYSDTDSELAKAFSKNANIRKGLIEIMSRGGDRTDFLGEETRKSIIQEFQHKESGELIVQTFMICFPTTLHSKEAEKEKQKPYPTFNSIETVMVKKSSSDEVKSYAQLTSDEERAQFWKNFK